MQGKFFFFHTLLARNCRASFSFSCLYSSPTFCFFPSVPGSWYVPSLIIPRRFVPVIAHCALFPPVASPPLPFPRHDLRRSFFLYFFFSRNSFLSSPPSPSCTRCRKRGASPSFFGSVSVKEEAYSPSSFPAPSFPLGLFPLLPSRCLTPM